MGGGASRDAATARELHCNSERIVLALRLANATCEQQHFVLRVTMRVGHQQSGTMTNNYNDKRDAIRAIKSAHQLTE